MQVVIYILHLQKPYNMGVLYVGVMAILIIHSTGTGVACREVQNVCKRDTL